MDDGGASILYIVLAVSLFLNLVFLGIILLLKKLNSQKASDTPWSETVESGSIPLSEAKMISNIFEFGDKEVQDIMTHRNNIDALDAGMPIEDAISFMVSHKKSRYPVYNETIDQIAGIIHLKDGIRFYMNDRYKNQSIGNIENIFMEAYFVPQTKNIDELFKHMQKNKLQMAIVVDEYGQTAGLVAMEDILEEIVGNIQDEYDEDKENIEQMSKDQYIIDGKTLLEELEERFGMKFDNNDFETLNGYLISKLDHIPEEDEEFSIDCGKYNFKILDVDNKVVSKVLVTKIA